MPEASLAIDESPEQNAEVVRTLALAVAGRPAVMTRPPASAIAALNTLTAGQI